ncbi:F-box/kelch-repeat protein At1g55270 isoform X2 [Cryptomeria japonica]|nr:F-box/kelch-repeat protein At1g55270 isoform X2 [Cryptomeria japonica]
MSTKFLRRGIPVKDNVLLSKSDRKLESNYFGILPVLPDDVALQCLARVPRMYHPVLRCVSKSWCQSIDSREFLEQRQLLGCSEDWLYLHVGTSPHLDERNVGKRNRWQLVGGYSQWHALDPQRYKWYTLPPIPYDQAVTGGQVVLGAASAVLHGKLYVIGGAPFGKAAIRDVWTYDPRKNKWRKGASMSTPRFAGLVGVIKDKLYVVGGSGMCHLTGYSIPCLEVYDPITNKWQHAASAQEAVTEHPFNPLKHSAVLEGYLCVTGPQNVNGSMNGGMYDPLTDKWSEIKPGLHGGWGKPSTVMDGKLYIVDFGCYKQYVPEDDCWVPVKCETEDLLLGWDPRLILAMSSSIEKLYVVGTMGSALIVMVVPVKNSKIGQSIRWHMMKIPSGIDFLGDMGYCSCQILAY